MRIAIQYFPILIIYQFSYLKVCIKKVEFNYLINTIISQFKYFIAFQNLESKLITIDYEGDVIDFFTNICPNLGYQIKINNNLIDISSTYCKNYSITGSQARFKYINEQIRNIINHKDKCIQDKYRSLLLVETSVENHLKIQKFLNSNLAFQQIYFKIIAIEADQEDLAEIAFKLDNIFSDPWNTVSGNLQGINKKIVWSGQVVGSSGEETKIQSDIQNSTIKFIITPFIDEASNIISCNILMQIYACAEAKLGITINDNNSHYVDTKIQLKHGKTHLLGSILLSRKNKNLDIRKTGHLYNKKKKIAFYVKAYCI